jgi:hypothetical protein
MIDFIESTLEFRESGYGFDWNAFKAAIEYYSRIVAPAKDAGYCYVLAATDRSVSRIREEGRFLDAPDTKQQREDATAAGTQLPVLVLLRQNGEKDKGWGGFPFWWPDCLRQKARGRVSSPPLFVKTSQSKRTSNLRPKSLSQALDLRSPRVKPMEDQASNNSA